MAAATVQPIAAPRQPAVVLGGSPPPRGAVSMARVAPLPPRRRTRFAPTPDPLAVLGGPGVVAGTATAQASPDSQVRIVAGPQADHISCRGSLSESAIVRWDEAPATCKCDTCLARHGWHPHMG